MIVYYITIQNKLNAQEENKNKKGIIINIEYHNKWRRFHLLFLSIAFYVPGWKLRSVICFDLAGNFFPGYLRKCSVMSSSVPEG